MSNASILIPFFNEPGLLTDTSFNVLYWTFTVSSMVIAVLGIATNAINVKTFVSMGVEDGITASFLFLACCDLTMSEMNLGYTISLYVAYVDDTYDSVALTLPPVDPDLFTYMFYYSGSILFDVGSLVTLFVAVTRCLCVVRPLQFSQLLTRGRSFIILSVCTVLSIAIFIPRFAEMRIKRFPTRIANQTRFFLWFTTTGEALKDYMAILSNIIIPFASQITVVICIFFMVKKLQESVKFRATSTATTENDNDKDEKRKENNMKLSGKERRAVQQVVVIVSIYVICNTPYIATTLTTIFVPDFHCCTGFDRYWRIYLIMHLVHRTIVQFNSSINLFVYLHFNSKFRESCKLC